MITADAFAPVWLPHQARLLSEAATCLGEVRSSGESRGILLLGASGDGKTHAAKAVEDRHPPYVDGDQRRVPVCVVQLPSKGDTGSLQQAILQKLGKPMHVTASLKSSVLEHQAMDALDACGVDHLIIEELHNSLLSGSADLRGQLRRFLKTLWNAEGRRKRVITLSATEEILPVFNADSELTSRYRIRICTTRVWFNSPDGARLLDDIVAAMCVRHGAPPLIEAGDKLMAARILFACRGHLRDLDLLVSRVATLATGGNGSKDPPELLARAFRQVLARPALEDPFPLTDDELRKRVRAAMAP